MLPGVGSRVLELGRQENNLIRRDRNNNLRQIMSLFNFFKKTDESTPPKPATSNYYYEQETVKLPPNFAQSLMELEMQMEFVESCDIQSVQKLNELYRIAIEYYANIDIKKSEHFQRKLTSLLTNPNTIDVIDQKQTPVKMAHLDPVNYSKNLKQELNKFNSQSDLVVKSMIEGNQRRIQQQSRLINEHLETQEDRLKRRLEERSRSKSKKKL